MNPYVIIAGLVLWGASAGGAFFYGVTVGTDKEVARQAKLDDVIQDIKTAAQEGAAVEIAKIKPQNVTIRQELEREIRTNTVYADCRVPGVGLRFINQALTGQQQAQPPGGGIVPRATAAE